MPRVQVEKWMEEVENYNNSMKPLDAALMVEMWPDIKNFVINIIETATYSHLTKTPYIRFRETEGKNRSKDIDSMILRNGGNLGDPYCVWGIQDILRNLEIEFDVKIDLPKTGGVLKLWERTKPSYKTKIPKELSIGCYQKQGTTQGHAVLVLGMESGRLSTFEFNTSNNTDDKMVRDGEGAHYKTRIIEGFGDMRLLGFIDIVGAMLK
jgi:hypothetical protein